MATQVALFEKDQRQKTLAVIAWTVLIASIALGLYDIQFQTWVSVIALFALGLACIPALILNRLGRTQLAAFLLSLVVLLAIALNLYDGDGVRDSGILALPIFMMSGTLMFGRRSAWLFAAASSVVLIVIVALEMSGAIDPTIGVTEAGDLVPMVLLLAAAAAIVRVIAVTVEQNLLRAREAAEEVRRSYDLTLEAWGRILEHRDREIRGHTDRVTALTERLARRMDLNPEAMLDLHRGALLHDIGKLALPDSILLKAGPLTDTEMAVIREHPARAHDVLAPIPYLQKAADIPWCHHEKWDGSGYPRGLRGEEIPLAARIFAVADVWDALTSDRPYRPAMKEAEALEHIRSLAGTHFDPRVVEAFLSLKTANSAA